MNSYKRLVDGYWAPTKVTWGVDNRTVALRVIPGSAKSTRVEVRVPGSDINPYLAIAASLAAGLYGIEKELPLTAAPVRAAPTTSRARSACRGPCRRRRSGWRIRSIAREILGETFVDHFVRTRVWEWRQFQDAVTDWELRRYFEVI